MEDEYFGPALPPESGMAEENKSNKGKYPKRKRSDSSSSNSRDSSSDSCTNSSNESGFSVQKCTNEHIENPSEIDSVSQRPAEHSASSCLIGPVMPIGFLSKDGEDETDELGPLPPGDNDDRGIHSTAEEIERRSERMKNKLLNPVDEVLEIPERETWMTELPPERGKNFGLTARKFSMAKHSTGGDRSVWTETPADRAKRMQDMASGGGESTGKPTEKITPEQSRTVKRDLEYAQQVEEYNKSKKRSKPLLELHNEKHKKEHKKQKKEKHKEKKKKRKKEGKEKKKSKKKDKDLERRPFDRDVDLKVNRMDDAQRKAIIERSQQLTGRFGHGSSSGKFL